MIIYKYRLEPEGITTLSLIKGWEILDVQPQSGVPVLWVRQQAEGELETVNLVVRQTGRRFEEREPWSEIYIGTFQLLGGGYVGHVFLVDSGVELETNTRSDA